MVMSLTPLQMDCARVIAELTSAQGRSPTFAEIADELDAGRSDVARLIVGLTERGWLKRRRHGAERALQLTREPPMPEDCDIELTEEAIVYLQNGEKQ